MLERLQPFRWCCSGEGSATGRGEQRVRYISWLHELGSCSPEQDRREAWCLAGTGGGSCSRRGTSEWELEARVHRGLGNATVGTVDIGARHCIVFVSGIVLRNL